MIRITKGPLEMRSYKIFINGIYRGRIKWNETVDFPVENGIHEVRAKIDWCSSNRLFVEVNNSTVNLEVDRSLMWLGGLRGFLYITFWRHKYLLLEEV